MVLHVKMVFCQSRYQQQRICRIVWLFPSELLEIDRYQLLSKSHLLISQEAVFPVKNKDVKERNQMRRQIGSTMTYFPVSIIRPWSLIFSGTKSPCGRPYYDLVANFLILHFPMWSLIMIWSLISF